MSETVTERIAEMKSSDTAGDSDVREIAHSVHIHHDNVYVDTLDGGRYRFRSLRNIAKNKISDLMSEFENNKQVDLGSNVRQKLKELSVDICQAWDDEMDMFRLQFNMNETGQINEFYIPFNSNLVDDVTVFRIYDDEGEFVAEDIENDIGEEMTRIETAELRVRTIPRAGENVTVYRKVRKSSEDVYDDYLEENTNFDSTTDAAFEWSKGIAFAGLLAGIQATIGISFLIVFAMIVLIPEVLSLLPRIITIPIYLIHANIRASQQEGIADKDKFFKTKVSGN